MKSIPMTRKRDAGFTLIELTVVLSIMLVLLGALYAIGTGMLRAARSQDSFIMIRQESRIAMQNIVNNLRAAQFASIQTNGPLGLAPLGPGPTANLQYRRIMDTNGNAIALNQDMSVGLSQPFTYALDLNDANGDGVAGTQLVQLRQDGTVASVLANHISPVVRTNDFFDTPLGGLVFQDLGGGSIQVTLILRHQPSPDRPAMVTRLDEIVTPRN